MSINSLHNLSHTAVHRADEDAIVSHSGRRLGLGHAAEGRQNFARGQIEYVQNAASDACPIVIARYDHLHDGGARGEAIDIERQNVST